MFQKTITTERLRKKFKNNFDLCNFAIQVGRNEILSDSYITISKLIHIVDRRADDHSLEMPHDE